MNDPFIIAIVLLSAWALIVTGFYILDKKAAKVTGQQPPSTDKKKDVELLEFNEKLLNFSNELKTLERRINDVDETSEARYRKISIRAKRADMRAEAEEELNRVTSQVQPVQPDRSQLTMFAGGNNRRLIKR